MSILWVFLPFCILLSGASGSSRILKRYDEDILSTWKNSAFCHMSSCFIRGKREPVNSCGAAWLEGYTVGNGESLVSSVVWSPCNLCVLRSACQLCCAEVYIT